MSFVLMVLGLLTTAVGAVLIGTGIPINEFNLGNTLILSGTVTVVSGLVIFAVSRVVSQLSRLADLLTARPLGTALAVPPPAPHDAQPGEPGRVPPPRPSAARPRAEPAPPRAPEPRLSPDDFGLPEAGEPVRPPIPGPRVPPPMAEEKEMARAPEPAARTGWRPPRPLERRTKPAPAKPAAEAGFAGWDEGKSAAPMREPIQEATRDMREEAVTVLKSGVVDGMAYTLYSDGSIEAELPQGVVRFGSIEELRNHLEKSA